MNFYISLVLTLIPLAAHPMDFIQLNFVGKQSKAYADRVAEVLGKKYWIPKEMISKKQLAQGCESVRPNHEVVFLHVCLDGEEMKFLKIKRRNIRETLSSFWKGQSDADRPFLMIQPSSESKQ